jgi:hypothetical protein
MQRSFGLTIMAAALVAGCSDASGPSADDLIGLWGGLRFEYLSDADPSQSFDLIADAGATFSLELVSGGTYESSLNVPGSAPLPGSGTYAVSSGKLTLTSDAGARQVFEIDFSGTLLELVDRDASYDFDGDQAPDAADLVLLLDRF